MTPTRRGRLAATLPLLLLVATLVSCSAAAEAEGSPEPTSAGPSAAESTTPSATPTPTAEAVVATCENIVDEVVLTDLTAAGWTPKPREDGWSVAEQSLPDGIACIWAEDHSVGTDSFLWFGWSPIDAAKAETTIAALQNIGYTLDETPDGRYVTEDPAFAINFDENGYGITYLFGDGWVAGAGTRTELGLVRVPEGWTP